MGTPTRGLPWRNDFSSMSPLLSLETFCHIRPSCPMSSSRALSSRSVDVRQCVAAHDPSEGRLHLRGGFSRKTFSCIGLVCVQCCSAGRCGLSGGLCRTTAHACSMLLLIGGRVPVPIVMPHQQNDAASEVCMSALPSFCYSL